MATTESASILRAQFFNFLFGDGRGYLCIASADKDKLRFQQKFFHWPGEQAQIGAHLEINVANDRNVWFCTSLLGTTERRKENCLPGNFAWADLDTTSYEGIEPKPSIVIESSPGRYQAYWNIEESPLPSDVIEDFSRRIAYKFDADRSGWDLTQLLRVPFTKNFKYNPPADIRILSIVPEAIPVAEMDAIEVVSPESSIPETPEPLPDMAALPTAESVIYHYKAEGKLTDNFLRLYTMTPHADSDWSGIMWKFIKTCFEIGMSSEETFSVAMIAACNKYDRDNRPVQYLWREVVKAGAEHSKFIFMGGDKVEIVTMPVIVDFDEVEEDAFINDYKTWANQATDAPMQYHELACFITLSALISAGLYLKVEWGEMPPNLWGLVLGESTLTRKTTAMRLPMDMLLEIDDGLILATDGSAEGLLTGLSHRPQRVSIFLRDEVSGFFDAINRKDYLAGLPEVLTQLYDVPKVITRLLRKDTVTITEPYFIFFGGGIRDRVYSLVNEDYILSGFLPRFLIVSGENDLSRFRGTGPPTQASTERKDNILRTLSDIRERYNANVPVTIAGQTVEMASRIEARLTPKAWDVFRSVESILVNAGASSESSMYVLPTFTRLAFSTLKMSMLVAASRREPTPANTLIVEDSDVKQAAFYVQKWGKYTVDLIMNTGKTKGEKDIDRALVAIKKREGLTKAEFMQRLHLDAKRSRELLDTLIQRGLIDMKPHGRGHRLYSI